MKKRTLVLSFILYLLLNIMTNVIHPITTSFVKELSLPDSYFGFFFSLMSLGQVIGALFWGFLSDKIGRKIPIIIGILGYALGQFGFGFIHISSLLILFFRIFAGFFIAAPNTMFISLILDHYEQSNTRVKLLSVLSGSAYLGSALGYELGGDVYEYLSLSFQQVFLVQIGLAILIAFALFFILDGKNKGKTKSKYDFKYLLKGISILPFIFLIGLLIMTIGTVNISKYLDVVTIANNIFSEATLGHYTFLCGIVGFASNILILPILNKLSTKKSKIAILLLTLTCGILCLLTFNITNKVIYMLYTTHILYVILKSCITPLEQNYLASFASKEDYGKMMGARQSMLSIGNVIGPLIGAAIYADGSFLILNISAIAIILSTLIFAITFIIEKARLSKQRN